LKVVETKKSKNGQKSTKKKIEKISIKKEAKTDKEAIQESSDIHQEDQALE